MEEHVINVLLAEDDPTDAMLLKESLAYVGGIDFRIEHVDCLAACLEAVRRSTFDAVLIDLGLPDSSGLETFRTLRDEAPGAVILVLSGLEDEETAIKAVQMGAEDYLMKSQVRTSLLGRMIRYAIERHGLKKQLEDKRTREAQALELRSMDGLSVPPGTNMTAGLYGGGSLRENMSDAFDSLARQYAQILDTSLELRTYKSERSLSDDLRELGNELGLLRAAPRDLVEIHSTVIRDKIRGTSVRKSEALLEEGRLAVLETMGYLAGFYRSFYTATARKGTPP
jgi:DNA-binding NarL/FixJ family response regulator